MYDARRIWSNIYTFRTMTHISIKNLYQFFIIILLPVMSIISCTNQTTHSSSSPSLSNRFKYAQNIRANERGDTIIVYVHTATKKDSITYILCDSGQVKPHNLQQKIMYIQVPITRVAALSTTEIACIDEIKQTHTIMAVCDIFRVSNPTIQQKYSEGKIIDLGTSMNENREKILLTKPDIVIKTLFSIDEIQKDKVLIDNGIPVLYINNWQEISPLGRTEWIQCLGLLYKTTEQTDSIFSAIETKYNTLKEKVLHIQNKPTVLAGDMIKDVWYLPGGNSYVAQFIKDAGGNYIYAHNSNTGSSPVNFEQLLGYAKHVDVWIGTESISKTELLHKSTSYSYLSVCKTKNCYNYHKRRTPKGGNDYWESGTIRADVILADLIHIFHPTVLPNHSLVYFQNIE